ncbi:hypothetical protein L1887_14345 [Cichorium endivia]|nr:hypothetical protein L1887_14345 [Cichorium endivia]
MDSRFLDELQNIMVDDGDDEIEKTKLTLCRVFIGGRFIKSVDEMTSNLPSTTSATLLEIFVILTLNTSTQIYMTTRPLNESDESTSTYNIIPLHDLLADHPSLRFPEVRAAAAALRAVGDLRKPPSVLWQPHYDLMDWLGFFFGFQEDNVSNQREHLVLHLANSQMRQQPPPDNIDTLDPSVLHCFRCKLLSNYTHWCSFIDQVSNISIADKCDGYSASDHRRELLYVALYLLIWGESANLRFVPESICYIFHNMAKELNILLEDYIDEITGRPVLPSISGENAFLNYIVTPIYGTLKSEVEINSKNGTAAYSNWRNYDDINEYFWSRSCFDKLRWPVDIGSNFFMTRKGKSSRKTGFVEQRSFLNLFRSFDKLWIMLILFLQAATIVAWKEQNDSLWKVLGDKDIQVMVLTIFITWSVLRFVQFLLDARMQYNLVSLETLWDGVRMVLKVVISAAWIYVLVVFYAKIWNQKNHDRQWSAASDRRLVIFLKVALAFVISELSALALFVLPWICNFFEKTNGRIFYIITWWFHSRSFVGGGLREGVVDNIKYSLFWILVLSTKFCFSYFLQIKPMIRPTKDLLDLREVTFTWHKFFQNSNLFAVGLLWLPVILIYLMDLQIWYSIYSSIMGMALGLFNRLGEIRNIEQLRLRFQFFASAMQFNLVPTEQMFSDPISTFKGKFKDAVHRMKMRYGFGRPLKKLEPDQVEAYKFALVWNEIILIFREEDIVSDHEVELLELPQNTWNVRVIRWPCFLLCNELLLALAQAKEMVGTPDKRLWYKMAKNEYRRCAVIEAYDSIKHLLLTIIKINTPEHAIFTNFFQEIENSVNLEKFTETFDMLVLPKIHMKVTRLLNLLVSPNRPVNQIVNTILALHEISTWEFFKDKRSMDQLQEDGLAPHGPLPGAGLLFENAVELPGWDDENFYRQVRRLHRILTSRGTMNNVPVNLEARRRIMFFCNSLFMNMPHAPTVEKMMAFSVLTPYYSEEVVYSKEKLRYENEDGFSILFYLQTKYPDEWENFLERMKREGMKSQMELWTSKVRELRLWASYRGQTLARTVRGVMYYNQALKLLALLDSASEIDNSEGSVSGGGGDSKASTFLEAHVYGQVFMKYTYVVACQIYGTQKLRRDPNADEILYLMKTNDTLRVAYVDEVTEWYGTEYYSVLLKYDWKVGKEVEIYRIKLPGPVRIGEGKHENQNHAIIFTRGEAVQTINMNQENYFEEALKIRNLLEEYQQYFGIRKPTILGVRESIFTGSVSSLAQFMSAQEMSFVTLGQRVLANPLKIRLHYGQPDVFDRFWFLTRGGLSKASRLINLSGDIFAGFNCMLRGGNVTHHEYIQVGKGQDVGFNQVMMFEAKAASGNGEQVLSRDVYRLGQRLDFFRMLSFYFTTVGAVFNTLMILLTVYTFLWGRLYFALNQVENLIYEIANTNLALGTILNQQFIVQLGLFTVLPMIVENSLELGFLTTIWDFITMQLRLSPIYFTFSLVTRAHYFGRTILHGGVKYRAMWWRIGVQHNTFADNYRLYARSHFVKAIELGLILILYAAYSPVAKGTFNYIAITISSWFLVFSWIMAPFIFNPSGFDWLKIVYDFDDFMNWIWFSGGVIVRAEESWEQWWYQEQDHLRTTGILGKLLEIILDLRFFFFQYGIVYQLGIAAGSKSITVYLLSWIYIVVALGIYSVLTYARDKYAAKAHIYYRLIQVLVIIHGVLTIMALKVFTHFKFLDLLTSLLAFIPTGWGLVSIAQVFRPALQRTCIWGMVVSMARAYDMVFGMIIFTPVAFLSWMPGVQLMQTRILFSNVFIGGLEILRSSLG